MAEKALERLELSALENRPVSTLSQAVNANASPWPQH